MKKDKDAKGGEIRANHGCFSATQVDIPPVPPEEQDLQGPDTPKQPKPVDAQE